MTGLDPRHAQDPPFVPWDFPEHDDAVKEIINVAWQYAAKMGLNMGVGVLDFADGTVVVLTHTVAADEMIRVDRHDENHILAGFAANPFEKFESMPDFTENMVEIKNPDAKSTVIGVSGIKK